MILTREQVVQDINNLSEPVFRQVAEFVAFAKFKERFANAPAFDEARIAELYAESADEDLELAESGMADYMEKLASEDRQ